MRTYCLAVILVIATGLVGCHSTGGTVGGLFPAPKLLKGNVTGDFYTSPDHAFQIQIPYPPSRDDYQWKYAKVTEGSDGDYTTWVIFGPAATDLAEYHAVLIKTPVLESLQNQADIVLASQSKIFTTRTGESPVQISYKAITINGKPGVYAAYENSKAYLVEFIVDHGSRFAHFEIAIPRRIPGSEYDQELRNALMVRKWERVNDFVNSFKVIP
jgi:hypothetical protein